MTGEDFYADTLAHEGAVEYMYLDTRGYVTCGVGHLLKTADNAAQLIWVVGNSPAPEDLVRNDWHRVAAMKDVEAVMAHRADRYYRGATTCRLMPETVERMCVERLDDEFIPGIRKLVDGFDDLPEGAQRALVDMAYNLGLGGLGKFSHFLGAVRSNDWEAAARQCHRSTCRDDRNEWTAAQLRSCA